MDKDYWNNRWKKNETAWDIGYASPVITEYINGIQKKDIAILIPGCGNAYEAEYLIKIGFSNITLIDISQLAVEKLQHKFKGNLSIRILCEDFLEHKGTYDLILEQTFFSAILPVKRSDYAFKMDELLNENGKIVGVLFNKHFNQKFPPFGGSIEEYKTLFEPVFKIKKMEICYNSILPRKGNELFVHFIKK